MRYALTCVALAGALVLGATAGPARAGTPCWQQVIDEWSAGKLQLTHPLRCYLEALKRAPTDVRVYSSLEEEVDQAVHAVSARQGREQPRRLAGVRKPRSTGASKGGAELPWSAVLAAAVAVAGTAVALGAARLGRTRRT